MYKNVRIGFGALSSYVSLTRNLYPKIDDTFKSYFNLYLRAECILVEATNNVLDGVHPDLVSLYNGRFFETRPVFELARILGYDVRCYENSKTTERTSRNRVFFENTLPQNIDQIGELINKTWESTKLSERERRDIGQSFFINRHNAIFAGDTIYIKDQRQDLLPKKWDLIN
jgi:hypothetical protein